MVSAPVPHSPAPANRAELSAGLIGFLGSLSAEIESRVKAEIETQVGARIEQAVERASALARSAAERELAGSLNQASRRLREASAASPGAVFEALLDSVAPRCGRAAVFSLGAGGVVRGLASRGLDESGRVSEIEFPVEAAAAFEAAAESRDPVVSAAAAGEVDQANVTLFAHPADDRVYLFPILARQQVVAFLYVPAGFADVEITVLELLAGMTGAALEPAMVPEPAPEPQAPEPEAPADSPLLGIAPAAPAAEPEAKEVSVPQWDSLPVAEQQAHARAQRLARVLVAEIRLYRPDAVRSGRARHDLYRMLHDDIDRARENYRQASFPGCLSMVDYLHLELVQSLANNDLRLLGTSYPGPLRPSLSAL
jgi:hypothetical protein